MPDFGTNINNRSSEYTAAMTLVNASGGRHTISLHSTKSSVTQDEVDDWASAVGGLTNMGLLEARLAARKYLPDMSQVLVYDEGGETAVFVFQNTKNPKDVQYVDIPEFDMEYYDANGIKLDDSAVEELITETKQIIDDGANITYTMIKAYIRDSKGKKRLETFKLGDLGYPVDVEEPTALGNPPIGPAGVI